MFVTAVTDIQRHPLRLTLIGAGEDVHLWSPPQVPDPLPKVVTVVTEVIVPIASRTSTA